MSKIYRQVYGFANVIAHRTAYDLPLANHDWSILDLIEVSDRIGAFRYAGEAESIHLVTPGRISARMQVRAMFERWRDAPDALPASQAIWRAERFSQSPVDLAAEPARDTSIPCYAYEFVDRNGKWHWRAEITPQQRAEIDSFLLIKRSVKIAYADLQLTIFNALSAATGRFCYELSGPKNLRAAASSAPDPQLVFEAIGALEDRAARQLALHPFTVHELRSGGLVFSLGTSRWPKKFTLFELRDRGAATEKNMRLALSRLTAWGERNLKGLG